MNIPSVDIGVFGGSGFYDLLDDAQSVTIETPYGAPSGIIMVGTIGEHTVAFLPRHGAAHDLPPHKIPYRANLWAMKQLGATRIIAPCACGSLQPDVGLGDFVILDQFVDRTNGRPDTFYNGPDVHHVSSADPYCPDLRAIAAQSCTKLGIPHHESGTVVVIQGPRFSTRAESRWFAAQGWEVINMTQYPEAYLARELDMCYSGIALITDFDAGVEHDEAVVNADVARVFAENLDKVKALLLDMIPNTATHAVDCGCNEATLYSKM
ncbi:MAG: S-methyl-5'-thioadenosine phosphorylase [Coriobacteriia bacterium]|nr:S-methyl-5'-thioadenosine phosphorylase [Coriobacteriia bacterium]